MHDSRDSKLKSGITNEALMEGKSRLKPSNYKFSKELEGLRGIVSDNSLKEHEKILFKTQDIIRQELNLEEIMKNLDAAIAELPDPPLTPLSTRNSSRRTSLSDVGNLGYSDNFISNIQISELADRVDGVGKNMEQLNKKVELLEKSLTDLKSLVEQTSVVFKVSKAIDKVVDTVKKPFVALNQAYGELKDGVKTLDDKIKEGVNNTIQSAGDFFKNTTNNFVQTLKNCKEAVSNATNKVLEITGKVLMAPVEATKKVGNNIAKLAESVNVKIKNFADETKITALESKRALLIRSDSLKDNVDAHNELLQILGSNVKTAKEELNKYNKQLAEGESLSGKELRLLKRDIADAQSNLGKFQKAYGSCQNDLGKLNKKLAHDEYLDNEIKDLNKQISDRNAELNKGSSAVNNSVNKPIIGKVDSKESPAVNNSVKQDIAMVKTSSKESSAVNNSVKQDIAMVKTSSKESLAVNKPIVGKLDSKVLDKITKAAGGLQGTKIDDNYQNKVKRVKRQAPQPPQIPNTQKSSNTVGRI